MMVPSAIATAALKDAVLFIISRIGGEDLFIDWLFIETHASDDATRDARSKVANRTIFYRQLQIEIGLQRYEPKRERSKPILVILFGIQLDLKDTTVSREGIVLHYANRYFLCKSVLLKIYRHQNHVTLK